MVPVTFSFSLDVLAYLRTCVPEYHECTFESERLGSGYRSLSQPRRPSLTVAQTAYYHIAVPGL
jgi:hypothetical protein